MNASHEDHRTLHVRPARAADTPAIAALVHEVHAPHAAAHPELFQPASATVVTPAELQRLAEHPAHLLLVAEQEGAIIGFAHAEVQETPATSYKRASALLHVHSIGVSAARQGHGVGRALLAAVRAAAAARGLGAMSLDVYAFNTAARAFYEREGFVVLRERLVAPVAMPPG